MDIGAGADGEVELDDRELARPLLHPIEDLGRHHMDASEGILVVLIGVEIGIEGFHLARGMVAPAAELVLPVEQQVAGGLPLADQQRGQGFPLRMMLVELLEIDVGENIDVVHQEGLVAHQEAGGSLDASSGV